MRLAASSIAMCRARSYHRGNVRSHLMTVARSILEEQGKAALSLRAISSRAGVALGTIYHHYDCKTALLAALAVEGFQELAERMQGAFAARGESTGLRAAGRGYVDFLFQRPALYQLMFEAVDQAGHPEVTAAERRAFAVLAEAIRMDRGEEVDPELAEEMAVAIWAWGRGLAALGFSRARSGEGPERDVVNAALRGMEALVPPPRSHSRPALRQAG